MLHKDLQEHKSHYTPYLGSAQCIAQVKYLGKWDSEGLKDLSHGILVNTAVTDDCKVLVQPEQVYHRESMPVTMGSDRCATFANVIFDPNGGLLWVKEGTFTRIWKHGNTSIIKWLNSQ